MSCSIHISNMQLDSRINPISHANGRVCTMILTCNPSNVENPIASPAILLAGAPRYSCCTLSQSMANPNQDHTTNKTQRNTQINPHVEWVEMVNPTPIWAQLTSNYNSFAKLRLPSRVQELPWWPENTSQTFPLTCTTQKLAAFSSWSLLFSKTQGIHFLL